MVNTLVAVGSYLYQSNFAETNHSTILMKPLAPPLQKRLGLQRKAKWSPHSAPRIR